MPAKAVKTFLRNPNMRKHRSHRSKKGERRGGEWSKGRNNYRNNIKKKRRTEELRVKELEREAGDIL